MGTVIRRSLAAALALALPCVPLAGARAQEWNDERTLALVRQATARRAEQLADSGLVDYQATAHGYLTFLAQLGEGFSEPPKVVKADELALQVYWRAPNLSKQWIIGRRDTTVLPTDIQYHRDHLGIVQNNFPAIIRLGEGDEVRDVPHPLSGVGLTAYDFAISDSLRMTIPGRTIDVLEVKVRPKDDTLPRLIGALYLDRETAQVVRMAFSFTRASFLDKQLEDLFIVLENGLVGTRFWLPRHQEVEIRRTATWLDYPVRGIIRGRWEIGDYQLNPGIPRQLFVGAEIAVAPRGLDKSYQWPSARILDSLPPDVRAVTADEIRRVQEETRALVRDQALRRARGTSLAARGVSDFVRFNRVEAVALGLGLTGRLGGGFSAVSNGRFGIADERMKGTASLRWQDAHGYAVRLFASDEYPDIGDVPERSLLVNSLAAQETGSDYTDLIRVRRAGAALSMLAGPATWTLEGARERQGPLAVHATPGAGSFAPAAPADTLDAWRARLSVARPTALWLGGFEMRASISVDALLATELSHGSAANGSTTWRGSADFELQRPVGHGDARFVSRTIGAAVRGTSGVPVQELAYFGGPVTAPGYDYHSLVGNAALSQRVELQFPVPFFPISLGRFGRAPSTFALAPYVSAVALQSFDLHRLGETLSPQVAARLPFHPSGAYPSAGVGGVFFFDLLRLDAARGLRDGRWSFYIDVTRPFWNVL